MNYNSCHEDDEEEEEEDEHSKDLHHQPPVGGDGLKIPKNKMNGNKESQSGVSTQSTLTSRSRCDQARR